MVGTVFEDETTTVDGMTSEKTSVQSFSESLSSRPRK